MSFTEKAKVPVCSVKSTEHTANFTAGRYKGISEEQYLCVFCDLCVVWDEVRVVFHHPLYSDLGNYLFEKIQSKNPDLFWLYEG